MKTVFTLKDLVKYAIFIGVVYALMRMIPSQEMSTRDIVLIVAVISVGFIFVDCLSSNSESFANINDDPDVKKLFDLDLDINLNSSKKVNTLIKEEQDQAKKAYSSVLSEIKGESIKSESKQSDLIDDRDPILAVLKSESEKNRFQDSKKISASNDEANLAGCGVEMEKLKRRVTDQMVELETRIKELQSRPKDEHAMKYMNFLIADLVDREVLDNTDVENIRAKINSKLLTVDDAITGLEKLKLSAKSKPRKSEGVVGEQSEYSFGNLPPDFYKPLANPALAKWDDGYTILNTDKWQVPMPRPPVCINTSPCKVCPNTEDTYPVNLGEWDSSRKVSNIEISKDWANKQVDPKESSQLDATNILSVGNKILELPTSEIKRVLTEQPSTIQSTQPVIQTAIGVKQ
jgi:hypothetical protein